MRAWRVGRRIALWLLLAMTAFAAHVHAQSQAQAPEPRIALIIANYKYAAEKDRLAGPVQDAAVLSKSLRERGFVGIEANSKAPTVEFNLTKAEIEDRVVAFKRRLEAAGPLAIGLVYYAGHGGSDRAGTDNFLIPVDVPDVAAADASTVGVAARFVRSRLESIDSHPKIMIVIDACRTVGDSASSRGNVPAANSAALRMAAPDIQQPRNVLMALSTGANQTASDSGLYAETLAEKISTAGLNLAGVFEETKLQVARKTGNRQIPVYQSQITEAVCLAGCTVQIGADPMAALKMAMDVRSAGDTGQIGAAEQLTRNGKSLAGLDLRGIYFSKAKLAGVDLSRAELGLTDFDDAVLTDAKLMGAFFIFSNMKNAKLAGADASETRFYFAHAEGGDFSRIRGERSNWQAAVLKGASFRNANLQSANFLNADLRDADFTGADLRGAFFIGALIKGAKFDQAQMANTDFTGAVGSAAQFTPAQQAQLCGTDLSNDRAYNYEVRTFDKSAAVGDRYRTLFRGWTPMVSGLRYLPVCATRAVVSAGKAPVWKARDVEYMTEGLTLEFPPDMIDAAGRYARLERVATSMWTTVQAEAATGAVVTVASKRSQELLETLRRNASADAKFAADPTFDIEAEFLYVARFQPQTISKGEWDRRAREWVGRDNRRNQPGDPSANAWPAFFPAGTRPNELNEAHVEQFRKWTLARAKQFPLRMPFDFRTQDLDGRLYNMQEQRFEPSHASHMTVYPVATYVKEYPIDPLLAAQLGPDANDTFRKGNLAIHSNVPVGTIAFDVPRTAAVRTNRTSFFGVLEITGSRVVTVKEREWVVLNARVKELYLGLNDGSKIKSGQ